MPMTRNQALENGTGCLRQVSTVRVALASDFYPEHLTKDPTNSHLPDEHSLALAKDER